MICKNCGGFCNDKGIFCLNCGYLLKDYKNIKIQNLNYSLDDDELLSQICDELPKTTEEYENNMLNFSNELNKYSEMLDNTTNRFSEGLISLEEHVDNISNIFVELSGLFENLIISIQGSIIKILHFLSLILRMYYKNEDIDFEIEYYEGMVNSLENLVKSIKSSKSSISSITIDYVDEKFDNSKNNVLVSISKFIILNESFVHELKFIKEKYSNINYMAIEDNHNHFCIYCGAKLVLNQKFCSQCGRKVYHEEVVVPQPISKYDETLKKIEAEYDLKQNRAKELVNKLFDPTHMSYDKFISSITRSNQLFANQLKIAQKMVELDTESNPLVENEIESKIKTLETFIDKMEDLINELVIQLSSNKNDNEDIENLFNDMDDLIHSVKDY